MERRTFLHRSTAAAVGSLIARRVLSAQPSNGSQPIVTTTAGRIRGLTISGVHAFKGVAYGASTTGRARFQPPAKPQPWSGVRDAIALGERCPQERDALFRLLPDVERPEPEGEDCLRLNVWTNGLNANGKRPVMVWLHGGGYATGSGGFIVYDGTELARKHDVVVVTVNHRLNIFGFLYLADIGSAEYAQATNAGMRDIVAALEWVRDNIAAFGGDPKKVTVFGQSGGAGKVSTLMAMPSAKGLFHRAIAESGAALTGVSRSDASASTETILARLNVKPSDVDRLQSMPVAQLLAATSAGGRGGGAPLRLSPVVDGTLLPRDPFSPNAPDLSADVPLLIGSTATEVLFAQAPPPEPLGDAGLRERVKQTLRIDDASADRLIAIYRNGRPMATNGDLSAIIATDVSAFATGPSAEAERKAAQAKAPVYKYYFSWYSPIRDGKLRAFHTLEIPFVFDHVDDVKEMTGTGPDRIALASRMAGAWTAFARTGNPNHKGLPEWRPFDTSKRATMIFDTECRAMDDPYREERLAVAELTSSTRR
jgi:para-nitrobenzyl esterase